MLNRFCSFTSIKTYVEATLDIGISLRYRIGKIICSKEEQLYDGFCFQLYCKLGRQSELRKFSNKM